VFFDQIRSVSRTDEVARAKLRNVFSYN
jgi:hypothetical protein